MRFIRIAHTNCTHMCVAHEKNERKEERERAHTCGTKRPTDGIQLHLFWFVLENKHLLSANILIHFFMKRKSASRWHFIIKLFIFSLGGAFALNSQAETNVYTIFFLIIFVSCVSHELPCVGTCWHFTIYSTSYAIFTICILMRFGQNVSYYRMSRAPSIWVLSQNFAAEWKRYEHEISERNVFKAKYVIFFLCRDTV